MASPTSRSTSRRAGDNGQHSQPGYMASTKASEGKQCQPTAGPKSEAPKKNTLTSLTPGSTHHRAGDDKQRTQPGYAASTESSRRKEPSATAGPKPEAPKKNSNTAPQCATKPVLNSTVSSGTSANTYASKSIAAKKAERPADEAPKSTTETPTPRDEVYSTTCSTWSFLQCSPASSLSTSPLPPYEEAFVDAPDYERDEGLPLAGPLLGTRPESMHKLPAKDLTKPGSNGTAKTGEPVNEKANPPSTPDDLACLILGDIDELMAPIGIDIRVI